MATIGDDVTSLRPGSPEAMASGERCSKPGDESLPRSAWDPMPRSSPRARSAVGTGMPVGIRADSDWNNPEPEVVLACALDGRIWGDPRERRQPPRLGGRMPCCSAGRRTPAPRARAVHPALRRSSRRRLRSRRREARGRLAEVDGASDGFQPPGRELDGPDQSRSAGSRGPALRRPRLARRVVLYLGTMFADPDRPRTDGTLVEGDGFTHRVGDRVRIASSHWAPS